MGKEETPDIFTLLMDRRGGTKHGRDSDNTGDDGCDEEGGMDGALTLTSRDSTVLLSFSLYKLSKLSILCS